MRIAQQNHGFTLESGVGTLIFEANDKYSFNRRLYGGGVGALIFEANDKTMTCFGPLHLGAGTLIFEANDKLADEMKTPKKDIWKEPDQ